jgi:hypothetical protein
VTLKGLLATTLAEATRVKWETVPAVTNTEAAPVIELLAVSIAVII